MTNTTLPGAKGVGLETALAGYAQWFNDTYLPGTCAGYGYAEWQDPYSVQCFNTYNASSPMYTDTSLSNTFDRQWIWFLCNQRKQFFRLLSFLSPHLKPHERH